MARASADKDVIKAFLGDDTEFKGILSFEGTVRIDGHFEGEVRTQDNLIIGEKARMRADVQVGTILIHGRMEGNIRATQKIHIAGKGKLVGNIITPSLHVEEGAILEGSVSMLKDEEKKLRVIPAPAKNRQDNENKPLGMLKARQGKSKTPAAGA